MTDRHLRPIAALAFAAIMLSPADAADIDSYSSNGGQLSAGGPAYEAVDPIATAWTWTGPYVGATAGYAWGKAGDSDITGGIGGATAGINVQAGPVLVGAEADFSLAGLEGRSRLRRHEVDWFSTVRGRVGYAFDRFLVYGTGG